MKLLLSASLGLFALTLAACETTSTQGAKVYPYKEGSYAPGTLTVYSDGSGAWTGSGGTTPYFKGECVIKKCTAVGGSRLSAEVVGEKLITRGQ